MPSFSFNAAAIEPQAPRQFSPLPAGLYEMIVVKSDIKPTKAGTGHYLELEMQVVEGEHSGRRHWERLNVDNPNKQAEDIAKAALSALCKAIDMSDITDTEELHDRPFVAHVEIDRKEPDRNRITFYSAVASAAPAARPAVSPKPAAAGAAKRPWA